MQKTPLTILLVFAVITAGCKGKSPGFCGNNILDGDEVCDGTNIAGQTCTTQGFAGGQLACSDDCLTLDTSGCCSNQCDTFADSECGGATGDTYRVCDYQENGCLAWNETDCIADGNSCFDYGPLALCVGTCEPNCQQWGEKECTGHTIRTCDWVGGCLKWVETTCFPVECGGDPIACIPSPHGRTCDDPYGLEGVTFPHRILGVFESGFFPDPPSCSTFNTYPLFLSYSIDAVEPAFITAQVTDSSTNVSFPTLAAFITTEATGICDSSARTELACTSDTGVFTSTISFDARDYGIQQGDVLYLLAHAEGDPLTNPTIDLQITDCANPGQVSLSKPPTTNAHPETDIELTSTDGMISMLIGTVELRQNGVPLDTYDLADHPTEVAVSGPKLRLSPTFDFALGATVEVVYDLVTVHCGNPISGTASFTVASSQPPTGESCTDPIPLANNGTSPVYWYEGNQQDVLSTHSISCLVNSVGGNDAIFTFTMDATATNAKITIPKTTNNGVVALVLQSCGPFATPLACGQDTIHNELILDAQDLVPGHQYYLVVGASSSQHNFPDPRLTEIHIQQYFSMNLVHETFDTWPAPGWTIEDLGDSGETWVHCPNCYGSGWPTVDHMIIPYGFPPITTQYDDSLITPSFSTHGFNAVYIEFNFNYWDWMNTGLTETRLEYRMDNGPWTLVKQIGTEYSQQCYELLLLPNANNKDNVQVRFRYLSPEKGSDWIIDNVRVVGVP